MNEAQSIHVDLCELSCPWAAEPFEDLSDRYSHYLAQVVSQSAELKCSLSFTELKLLTYHLQLNDTVISEYFNLLKNTNLMTNYFVFDSLIYYACFKMSKYNYERTARVSGLKKGSQKSLKLLKALQDPEEKGGITKILMPSNPTGGHWVLVQADLLRKEWWIFDSCGQADGIDESVIDNWEAFLKDHWNAASEDPEFPQFFRPQFHHGEHLPSLPQQRNGTHNCGPFVCMFARVLFSFDAEEMDTNSIIEKFLGCEEVSLFRKLMFVELVEGKLCNAERVCL